MTMQSARSACRTCCVLQRLSWVIGAEFNGLNQVKIDELCGCFHQYPPILFQFSFQYVERWFIFADPGLHDGRLVDCYGKQKSNDKPGCYCRLLMGKKAIGHCRIEQQGADAPMQISRISLIYPAAGKLSLDTSVIPDNKIKFKSGKILRTAADAIRMCLFSCGFERLLIWICHVRII
jgi:hypothetical protein